MSQLKYFLNSNRNILKILNRAYNHTTRVCRRPLVEECLPSYDGGYSAPGAAAEPELVCETFYETECRTVIRDQPKIFIICDMEKYFYNKDLDAGPDAVIRCDQVERMICAEDNCRMVEVSCDWLIMITILSCDWLILITILSCDWWRARRSARTRWWRTRSACPRRPAPWTRRPSART